MRIQLNRMGVAGLFLTALVSPCCFPLFGLLLSALGLGSFELFGGWTMWVFEGFVLLSLIGTFLAYRKHRQHFSLLIALPAAALIFYSYHVMESAAWIYFMYAGMLGLMASAVIDYFQHRKRKSGQCLLHSSITCPACGFTRKEQMPENACTYFYECTSCKIRLKPKAGDCCVFCSYGTVPCPPVQSGAACC